MLRTFNCGVGMVAIVDPHRASRLTALLTAEGETVFHLGAVMPRSGEAVVFNGSLELGEA